MADWWANDPVAASPAVVPKGDNWWHADPVVEASAPSTTMDVVKSAGRGLVKGTEALLGFPADVKAGMENLVGKGVKVAGSALGFEAPSDQTPSDLVTGGHSRAPLIDRLNATYAPTSEHIGQVVEGATGPMGTPQTPAGKYTQSVAEIVPGAVAMGPAEGAAGVATNIGKLAVLPGLASEYLGNKVEGTWMEPYARLVGALGGGTLGSAGSKIGEIVANRGAARTAAATAGGDIPPEAITRVAKNYEADKLTPEIVAQRQAQLGPEAMTLDMGRQMLGRAMGVASQEGAGQNRILDAVEGRVHGMDQFGNVQHEFGQATADRIKDTLDQTMGPSPDIVAYQKNVNNIVDQHAKPLYDQVMNAHPVVNVPDSITSRRAVGDAMKRAVDLASNYGEQLEGPTETKTILSGDGYHIAEDVTPKAQPSLRYWDYVKKAMDQRIRGIMQSGDDLTSAQKADLGGLQSARTALVKHLDDVTGGAYAVARKVAATKPEVREAIEMGRGALNSRLLPEELADEMQGMSLPQQSAVKAGFRREVDRIVDTARNDGAAARRILDTNQNREKIAQVFGPDAAQAVDDRIMAETKFQHASNQVAGNSLSALRIQLAKDTESPSISQPPSATGLGLLHAAARRGQEYLGNMMLERTREGIADLLTRRGNDIPTLAKILSDYGAARAANAAPPIRQQARGLASVLATQSPGWFSGYLPGNQPKQPGQP